MTESESRQAGKRGSLRLLTAVLVSTFVALPLVLLQAALFGDINNPLLVPYLLGAFWISAIFVVLVGLPVHFALRHMNKQMGANYAGAGFFAAAVFTIIGKPFGNDGYPLIAIQALQLGIFGAVAALVFWRIAVSK